MYSNESNPQTVKTPGIPVRDYDGGVWTTALTPTTIQVNLASVGISGPEVIGHNGRYRATATKVGTQEVITAESNAVSVQGDYTWNSTALVIGGVQPDATYDVTVAFDNDTQGE